MKRPRTRRTRRWVPGGTVCLVLAGVLTCTVSPRALSGQPVDEVDGPTVVCSASDPVTVSGAVIRLRAWLGSADEADAVYRWAATVGEIEGGGQEVGWNLSDVEPGYHRATLEVVLPSGTSGTCSVQVKVTVGRKGEERLSGKELLVRGERQRPGYGLYSYLLIPTRPTDEERAARTRAAFEAFLALIPDIEAFQGGLPLRRVNLSVLPVEEPAPSKLETAKLVDWLMEHYDFARARELLLDAPGPQEDGPYLVSGLKPLTGDGTSDELLVQDLSWVPPHLVAAWVREFLNQAEQSDAWEGRTLRSFALKLRTIVGVLGEAVEPTLGGVKTWIAVLGKPSS